MRNVVVAIALGAEVVCIVFAVMLGGWWIVAAIAIGFGLGAVASAGPGSGPVEFTITDSAADRRDERRSRRDATDA